MKNIIPYMLIFHYALYKYYWLEQVIMYVPRNGWLETVRFAINLLVVLKILDAKIDNAVNDGVQGPV